MKGFSSVLYAAALISVVLVLMGLFSGIFGQSRIAEIELKQDVYSMSNALDAAKVYLHTALRYSVYQGIYDSFRNGCRKNSDLKYWYDSSNADVKPPSENEMLDDLRMEILENLNKYAENNYNFMDYSVYLPAYTIVYIERDAPVFSAFSEQDDVPRISKTIKERGESITLKADSSLAEKIDFDYSGLYTKGKEILDMLKANLQAIESELESERWATGWDNVDFMEGESCSDVFFSVSADDKLISGTDSAEEYLKSFIEENFRAGIAGDDNYDVVLDLIPLPYSGDRPIKISITQEIKDTNKMQISCRYMYDMDFDVEVNITYKGMELPVFNGTQTAFSPVSLVFYAREAWEKT